MLGLSGPREDQEPCLGELVTSRLEDDVGGGPEPEEAQRLPILEIGQTQGAIPDDARAQQGRGLDIAERLGDRIDRLLGGDHVLGVAPVRVATRSTELLAEVLLVGQTEVADAA